MSTTKYNKWDDINIDIKTLRGIYAYGFEVPSPIQSQAIEPIIKGTDVIAQAQSGTGKTGCFTIATLSSIDITEKKTQAILLSPTRELATQTYNVLKNIGKFHTDLTVQNIVGGTPVHECINQLHSNIPHIIVGCPGRIFDMLYKRHIESKDIKLLILDEADEMLSVGFKDQIYDIFQYLPEMMQVGLFSATLSPEVMDLTGKFMKNPVNILVKNDQLTLEGIKQHFVKVNSDTDKLNCLKDLYSLLSLSQSIIYCNSVKRVDVLYNSLIKENYPVTLIHSNLDKIERQDNYKKFVTGEYRVLISTNLTSRGIDVQQVSTVINFDMPKSQHTYLHRIGRSGRWGRKGLGISFVSDYDSYLVKDFEKYYTTSISELPEDVSKLLSCS